MSENGWPDGVYDFLFCNCIYLVDTHGVTIIKDWDTHYMFHVPV